MLEHFDCRLNLDHVFDMDQSLWNRLVEVYASAEGWMGFSGEDHEQTGIPYWYGFDETRQYIHASVEPGGIQFSGFMEEVEWNSWIANMKEIGTQILGFKVGEIELGEVGHEIEWVDDDKKPG